MKNRKALLSALFVLVLGFGLILPCSVEGASATGRLSDDRSIVSAVSSAGFASAIAVDAPSVAGQGRALPMVAAGYYHTVGLKADGTVVAIGENRFGQCDVGSWTDIVRVAAGSQHTVGLKADGRVVATGDNAGGKCNVGDWASIIRIAAGNQHTVGLKGDGTVVAVGDNTSGQCDVEGWSGIVQVAAGYDHTVGIKADGTVVAAGPEVELAKWNLGVVEYTLIISSTHGGSVIAPGDGMFTYNAGVMVRLIAKPESGCRRVRWIGDMDTIANVNAGTTVITMEGDYQIAANFPINWPLIGGITAAEVVIVWLAVFLVRRRRAARTRRQGRRKSAKRRR
jgi:hypothetical protein